MFGENPIRGPGDYTPGLYRVQQIFPTIQGEGPFAGLRAVFVRLAGCNLRCHFCDTDFESGWANVMSAYALVQEVVKLFDVMSLRDDARQDDAREARLVVVTGGEPLLQDPSALLDGLIRTPTGQPHGYHVQFETAGTVWQDTLARYRRQVTGTRPTPDNYSLVVSPKTPKIHPEVAMHMLALKYVVGAADVSSPDGLPLESTQTLGLARPPYRPPANARFPVPIYVQPMDAGDQKLNKRNVDAAVRISMERGYRLSLQLHKLVGVE